jgi:hypothetical protein
MPNDRTSGRDGTSATNAPASAFAAPHLALPKGGGALRGTGETFAANLATGTGALTLPIPLSLGRSGSGPQLSLSYGSADSNGPFGFGWRLGLAEITRRTDKGLPVFDDAPLITDSRTTDIFILSGTEDLVPLLTRSEDRDWHVPQRRRARATRSRPIVRGPRGCSHGSSAGRASLTATATGARSRATTCSPSTASTPTRALPIRTIRAASSPG